MKMSSTSLAIGNSSLSVVRYNCTSIKIAKVKVNKKNKGWWDMGKQDHLHCWGGQKIVQLPCRTTYQNIF